MIDPIKYFPSHTHYGGEEFFVIDGVWLYGVMNMVYLQNIHIFGIILVVNIHHIFVMKVV